MIYRTSIRDRFNPPRPRLTPMRAFRFGMRMRGWSMFLFDMVRGYKRAYCVSAGIRKGGK